jgi:1-acyl-sn-glycerol-3-phosphate acyltransferase
MGYTLNISARFLVDSFFGKGTVARADELLDWYWRQVFQSGNATLLAEGRDQLTPGKAYIYMSNHGSLMDIPVIFGAVPGSVRMVSKEELTRVPVWGQAIVAAGFIPIDRKNRERAIRQLEVAKQQLAKGVSVWIAPEGTRSRRGGLGPFKKGGFHTALALGVPIVPVWIDGANNIIPPDQFIVNYDVTVTARFGAPIDTTGLTKDDLESLMQRVRTEMVKLSGQPDELAPTEARAQAA